MAAGKLGQPPCDGLDLGLADRAHGRWAGGVWLVNRIRIQPMGVGDNPVVSFFVGNGAFIMEQRMMNGIKTHAEGWVEPPYQEAVEIALWLVALLAGLAGAVLFVARRSWIAPLAVAVASVGVILVFTFAQPPIAMCVLLGMWRCGWGVGSGANTPGKGTGATITQNVRIIFSIVLFSYNQNRKGDLPMSEEMQSRPSAYRSQEPVLTR